MNINNFEDYINDVILARGYDYYLEGAISDTEILEDNEYIFQVEGTDDYEVNVKIDDSGEILYSSCDCPYDFGEVCKHEVAVYHELRDILSNNHKNDISKINSVKKPNIKDVLSSLPKEELINIIIDITEDDTAFKDKIIFKYFKGDNEQEIEKCKKLIKSIVKKYTYREGYIKYRDAYEFRFEIEEVLDKARDTNDVMLALDITLLVLNEGVEAFQYADDSDGDIGSLVTEAIEVISEITDNSKNRSVDLRTKIFNKILEFSDNKALDGWGDYKTDLLSICAEFADIEILRDKLKTKIQNFINNEEEHSSYDIESMLTILLDLIDGYGTREEAEQFIKDNIHFTSFREKLINKYIEEKNYHKVIELALEGEEKDKEYRGLVIGWKKIRYNAYKELSLKEEQEKLAKELLFKGSFEYYKDLKELAIEDKESFYKNLKQELRDSGSWGSRGVYLKIIEEENDLDEIMEVVRKNPENIEKYANMIAEKFKDEVIEIYKTYIELKADNASDRGKYKEVCSIIKRYKKIAGSKNQQELIEKLNSLYKRRPAFIDELSKL